jgi:hypothetical protein
VNPRDGNGSVQMTLTDGTGKVDFAYSWGFVSGRTLGNLNVLSYDWYRSGTSTNPGAQQPAFRLAYDADGNSASTSDQGYLIWEATYNGGGPAVTTNQWVSSDMLGGNFWLRQFSPGFTVENYETNLNEWMNGPRPAGSDVLSADTAILGIEFGIGSGWNGVLTDMSIIRPFVSALKRSRHSISSSGRRMLFRNPAGLRCSVWALLPGVQYDVARVSAVDHILGCQCPPSGGVFVFDSWPGGSGGVLCYIGCARRAGDQRQRFAPRLRRQL